MKVTITESYYQDYPDGDPQLTSQKISALNTAGKKISYRAVEGEPEDMRFGRDLEQVYSIEELMIAANEAGLKGESLTFETIEEQ